MISEEKSSQLPKCLPCMKRTHLEKYIPNVTVCLFKLIKQKNLVWSTTDTLRQNPRLVIANCQTNMIDCVSTKICQKHACNNRCILTIAGWCSNQSRNSVLLSVLGQINACHGIFIVKNKFSKGFCCFSLANSLPVRAKTQTDECILMPSTTKLLMPI